MFMRVWLFLFLYGSSISIGAFLISFWSRMAFQRCKAIEHPCMKDRAFVLSSSIAVMALGVSVVEAARMVGTFEYGLSATLQHTPAYFIIIGFIILLVSFFKMTWLADLENHPPRWVWLRIMIGVTLLWIVIAALLTPEVPFFHG